MKKVNKIQNATLINTELTHSLAVQTLFLSEKSPLCAGKILWTCLGAW